MNSLMEYKGYHGTVFYDADDNILYGEILGITDSLNYHGRSIDEIEKTFHECVDEYLELCREIGKEPEKEYSGRFSVRIDPDIHKMIYLAAANKKISLNKAIEEAIVQYSCV